MKSFLTTQKATRRLLQSVYEKNYAHSYIFEGLTGVGKFTAALLFASALHCTGEKKPCGICPDCKKHCAGVHPDLYIIDKEGTIKVDDIRNLTEELFIRPAVSKKKIFIIRNADNLTQDAQNALLKAFEEPPEYAIIILISSNSGNLLQTVRSRGVKIEFEAFSEEDIFKYLTSFYNQNEQKARFIAKYSGGVIGRAIRICEDESFFSQRQEMFEKITRLTGARSTIFDVAELFGIKNKSGFLKSDFAFELFLSFMRDVLALKTQTEIINVDMKKMIEDFSSKVTLTMAITITERALNTKKQLNASMKYDLWIVDMLINCWEDIHGKSSRN